ncbi:Methylenetetrahydrofolate--tRNA-(uracil-5-)-methyltransferase TrmFO [bacterium HR40]|nr:Methylenetetrahydrofolate--tRNA-(uracil-5-)-methyltransferase TrmFO [bacterium HR40]
MRCVHVVGGGLAGSEAAFQLARRGVPVVLHEMRPVRSTEAHRTDRFAELVCSNSFRSDDASTSAVGLLHAEMRQLGSLVMWAADRHRLPAGAALAVDRDGFAETVTRTLARHPRIEIRREPVDALPPPGEDLWIIATGPLTSPPLAHAIRQVTGEDQLAFFDAIAPIVYRDSIDFSVAWMQSRWNKTGPAGSGTDYINCPLDRAQYEAFVAALRAADTVSFHDWEKDTPFFEGCLPIEVMAARGVDTLRFGPMKPVGLVDPRTGRRPWAVVQLRQDNALGTLWNMVGFQTKLRHAEQLRIFRTIPGLERAEFARLGGIHRNTFVNGPRVLDRELRLKGAPQVRLAGQITGVEGYVESAACGLLAALFAFAELRGRRLAPPPRETAHGALLAHVTGDATADTFQPMNVNFGLFPPLAAEVPRAARKRVLVERALAALARWIADEEVLAPGLDPAMTIG